ncbi:MAG: amidase [Thermoanaerobaculaceae bacterium]
MVGAGTLVTQAGAGAWVQKLASGREQDPAFPFAERTVRQLQQAMETGELTAETLTAGYLERIAKVDPLLHSLIETNLQALEIARERDRERRSGLIRGPLHGIPVIVKDNIATNDQMETTAGSLALVGHKPPKDAFVVERLRQAGAVILAKANLSEWANFRSTHSSSGWSARGGQCRNPYALDRSPCGSSSGTAAAVSANLAALGVGTETDGSIVCPAHNCGLVGLKPTLGLVSRAGIVPIAQSQDTAGPMTRTVEDAAILLQVLAARDLQDPATASAPEAANYGKWLRRGALKGARLGVARQKVTGYHPGTDRIFTQALETLKDLGAVLLDPADIPHLGEYDEAEFQVLLYEFKHNLERYLATWAPSSPYRSLADLIAFNEAHAGEELPYFGQEIFELAAKKGPLSEPAYRKAKARCLKLSREKGLDALFSRLRLDALVMPTGAPAWVIDLVNGDHYLGGSSTPAAVAGYPAITVPAGFVHGLPVGLTFLGRPWAEAKLLGLAYDFEQAQRARQAPRLLPTLPFPV